MNYFGVEREARPHPWELTSTRRFRLGSSRATPPPDNIGKVTLHSEYQWEADVRIAGWASGKR
jgi:hypothetical protein